MSPSSLQMRHPDSVAKEIDRSVNVILREDIQFSLGLGEDKISLSETINRQVVVGHTGPLGGRDRLIHNILVDLVASACPFLEVRTAGRASVGGNPDIGRQTHNLPGRGSLSFISSTKDILSHPSLSEKREPSFIRKLSTNFLDIPAPLSMAYWVPLW